MGMEGCLKSGQAMWLTTHLHTPSVHSLLYRDNSVLVCRSWYHASWYISIVKPTRCIVFEFIEYHSTCFGWSFRLSSGVVIQVRWLLASKQSTNQYDIHLMLYVQSWTPDDGLKDRPKHVEWYSINSKIVHLVGFAIEICAGIYLLHFFRQMLEVGTW